MTSPLAYYLFLGRDNAILLQYYSSHNALYIKAALHISTKAKPGTVLCLLSSKPAWALKGLKQKNFSNPASMPTDKILLKLGQVLPGRKRAKTEPSVCWGEEAGSVARGEVN